MVSFRAAGVGKVCFSQDMLFVLYLLFDSNFPSVPGLEISRFHIPSYYLTSRSQMFNFVSQEDRVLEIDDVLGPVAPTGLQTGFCGMVSIILHFVI